MKKILNKIKKILIKKGKCKKIKDKKEFLKKDTLDIKEVERIEVFKAKYRKYIYTITLILSIYLLLIIFAKPLQSLFLFPEVYIKSGSQDKIIGELITIKNKTGKEIKGTLIKGFKKKTIFYFYDSKKNYLEILKLNRLGYTIIFYDYKNEIRKNKDFSIENLSNISNLFYLYIMNKKGIRKEDIIIIGQGKGAILASDFSVRINDPRLILIEPIFSTYNLAKNKVGFIFQKMLFLQNILTKNILAHFYNNILIIAGNNNKDNLFIEGKDIFRSISSDEKYFIELDNPLNKNILTNYDGILDGLITGFIEKGILESKYTFLDKDEVIKLIKEKKQINLLDNIDLKSDKSLTKFVNNKISYFDIGYKPTQLISVGGNHIIDSKGSIKVKKNLKDALQNMANDFYKETKNNIVVVSGYRSYLYQKGIKDRGCPDNLCAKAGYSEHQSGLAIDLYSASSNRNWANNNNLKKYYKWLSENAHKYGFTNTYQKGLNIDGYEIEPWHWRYIGKELATLLKEKGITFAEFYNEKISGK